MIPFFFEQDLPKILNGFHKCEDSQLRRYTHHVMCRVWTDWIHWIKGLRWITEKVVHKCKCPHLSQLHIKTFHLFSDDIMFILKFKSYVHNRPWALGVHFSTHPLDHQDMCPTCWSGRAFLEAEKITWRSLENAPIFNRRCINSNGCFVYFVHFQMVVLSIVHFQMVFNRKYIFGCISDEQMSKGWPFFWLANEQLVGGWAPASHSWLFFDCYVSFRIDPKRRMVGILNMVQSSLPFCLWNPKCWAKIQSNDLVIRCICKSHESSRDSLGLTYILRWLHTQSF